MDLTVLCRRAARQIKGAIDEAEHKTIEALRIMAEEEQNDAVDALRVMAVDGSKAATSGVPVLSPSRQGGSRSLDRSRGRHGDGGKGAGKGTGVFTYINCFVQYHLNIT